jgi:U4/U6.U5 tri-snRNP-associated protein 1
MADIDIEAANRLRVAMGLKPMPVPGAGPVFKEAKDGSDEEPASTLETRTAAAEENYRKSQNEVAAKAKRLAQKEAIKKARDAAMRDMKLTGKSLGDDEGDVDTATWLRQQAKRQKRIDKARRLEEELAAREKEAEYTASDLAGVKVGHELNQIEAGSEQVLTLKDTVIGDESEDDELENVDLRESERLNERLELKKRKPVYNPNDVDETGERKILAHYDEEIDGKQGHRFTLDGQGSTREQANQAEEDAEKQSKGVTISLDFMKEDIPVSDYVHPSEIKIRKPKKKKSKSTRKKAADDDDIFPENDEAMEVDMPQSALPKYKKRSLEETEFVDDEDLQSKLAQQRRVALKKRKRMRPEDLAKQVREEEASTMDGVYESIEEAPGLVLDETSEFVAHLDPEAPQERSRRKSSQPSGPNAEDDEDVDMEESYGAIEEREPGENDVDGPDAATAEDITATGLDEEGSLNHGLGATLALLKQRRLVDAEGHGDLNVAFRNHQEFLAEKQAREQDAERKARLQRERDRQSGRLDRMSAREREDYARQNNAHREQVESRAIQDLFNKEYKPNVELKYIDEFGRSMNAKEAFKQLSHQFHGKGSGKQKHEKLLKKIEEEKKREAMSSLDNSHHAATATAKKNQQAGVRLQ